VLDVTMAYGLTFMFPQGDEIIGKALRSHGEFARPEVELISAYLDILEPGTFLDVGANIGSICLPVAASHPDWTVWAVEGNRGTANVLATNAMTNHLWNVEAVHAVAGPSDMLAAFPSAHLRNTQNFGTVGVHTAGGHEIIRMAKLDTLAPADTRFIKVDVEGFEARVLEGAVRLLKERSVVWLIEAKVRLPETLTVLATLRGAGYRLFWFFAPFVTAAPNKPGTPMVSEGGDLNCLALPPDVPNLWDLREGGEGEQPRLHFEDYPYLKNYGFR